MIIDSKNETQKSILTNKCFYQTTAQIMHEFEKKGMLIRLMKPLRLLLHIMIWSRKKPKITLAKINNEAFKKIDDAIKGLANKVFYGYENKSLDYAYKSFAKFDYINAIIGRQRIKKKL